MAEALAHAADANAGASGADLAEAIGGDAGAVVADFGGGLASGAGDGDHGSLCASVAVDIGERFLDEAEENEFDLARETSEVVGNFDIDRKAGAFREASGIPIDGRAQATLVEQWRVEEVRGGADLALELMHGLADVFDISSEFRRTRRLLPELIHFHTEDRERLSSAVVELAGDVAALFVSSAHDLPGEFLQFTGAGADFGIEGLGEAAVFLLAQTQKFGVTDLGSDVAGNLGGSGYISGGIPHRRNGERDVDQGAVFAAADRLEMVDALAATQALQDFVLFLPALGRNDQGNVLADGFFGGVAEYAFGALVPAADDAIERLADDGVVGRVDDGGEQGSIALGALAIRDFTGDLGSSDNTAGRIFDWRDSQGDVDDGTVLALANGIEMLNPFAATDAGEDLVLFRLTILGDNQRDMASDGFLGAIAEGTFGGLVPAVDDAVGGDADDDVVGGVDDGSQQIAGLIAGTAFKTFGGHISFVTMAVFESAFEDRDEVAAEIGLAAVGAGTHRIGLLGNNPGIVLADEDDIDLRAFAKKDAGGVEAVHAGHADVHQDDIGTGSAGLLKGLLSVGGFAADLPIGMEREHG